MIDTTTRQPLTVSTDGGAGPYIVTPVLQLDQIVALLAANQVVYWVDVELLSIDGKPEVAFINLGRGSNPTTVQHLLDSVS